MTGTDAWSALGTDVSSASTAAEAMALAGLDGWGVRLSALLADVDGHRLPVPDRFAIVRGSTFHGAPEVLGVCGDEHQPVQNEQWAPFLDGLVEATGATFGHAGQWDGGRRAFVTLRLPGFTRIGGDVVRHVVGLVISHDPKVASTHLVVTPVHERTGALLNLAWGGSRPSAWRVTHPVPSRHADQVFDYLEVFADAAHRLADAPLRISVFDRLAVSAFGPKAGAAANTVARQENACAAMSRLFADQPSHTVWAAVVALAAYSDHLTPTRGSDRDTARRVRAILDPSWKTTARLALGA